MASIKKFSTTPAPLWHFLKQVRINLCIQIVRWLFQLLETSNFTSAHPQVTIVRVRNFTTPRISLSLTVPIRKATDWAGSGPIKIHRLVIRRFAEKCLVFYFFLSFKDCTTFCRSTTVLLVRIGLRDRRIIHSPSYYCEMTIRRAQQQSMSLFISGNKNVTLTHFNVPQ